ncbi:hypothetical protein EU245_10170 [Lentibacillus lipolyticus]|nr:hypothetical protein EU245_10170 [Lentibacillus lipolyticus]
MGRRKLITAFVSLVLLIVVTTFVLKFSEVESANREIIQYDHTLSGESKHWTAELQVKGERVFYEEDDVLKGKTEGGSEFILTYRGPLDELASVREISYEYGSTRTSLRSDEPLQKKVFNGSTNKLPEKDATIDVMVQWGDKTETFTLTADNQ